MALAAVSSGARLHSTVASVSPLHAAGSSLSRNVWTSAQGPSKGLSLECSAIRAGSYRSSSTSSTDSTMVRSVPVQVAHDLLKAGHHYLDVRTPEEFAAGHVEGATNIPFMYKAGSGMNKNPKFVNEVSSHFNKHDEIVVGCQSGKRSMMAASELMAAGFSELTDMGGGFSAWVQSKLPVSK